MDTLGPVSVLDSGRRSRDVIITDRITRRRSPDRPRLKAAHSEQDVVYRIPQPYRTSFSARQSVERIPATDRSRSLSPTSSLRSTQSCRSERTWRGRHSRAKSPKRVTYDTRVTVRHSDTDDSIFTELSSHDLESSLCHTQKPNSTFSTSNHSEVSKDSGLDYSVQLKDLSDQIIKMDWSRKQPDELHGGRASSGISSSSILKDSQNSRKLQSASLISAVNQSSVSTHAPPSQSGDKENTPNGSPQPYSAESGAAYRTSLSPDYQPDRSYSYRQAISDHYSSDVRALVDAGMEEKGPCVLSGPETGGLQQRSNSVTAVSKASSPTSSQLTPAKRSVSTSISNFFRRISPHLGRKRGKSRGASSTTASSQSLPAATGHQVEPATPSPTSQNPAIPAASSSSGHFSHNKIRSSFLKLMGKPSKESKSKMTSRHCSHAENLQGSESVSPASCGETPGKTDERDTKQLQQMPESAQRVLKSIEKSNLSNKNIYREFKDKRSPHGSATAAGADSDLEERYRAIKAQYKDRPLSYQDNETAALLDDIAAPPPSRHPLTRSSAFNHSDKCDSSQYQKDSLLMREEGASLDVEESGNIANKSRESNNRGGKVAPPSSLDVVPPRAIRLLQASTISTISGDESIGECSLDCNLTASEPSLLSGNSQSAGSCLSKKAVLNQSLISSTEGHLPSDNTAESSINTADTASCVPQRRQKDALILGQELLDSVSKLAEKDYTSPVSPLSPPSAPESAHKPSYLKLSCAVSGYGKYSRYSSYKSIPTRSPFSSTSSLRSDLSSPDPIMPSLRSPDTCGELRVQSAGGMTSPSYGAGEMAQTLKSEPYDITPSYNGHLPIPTIQLTGDPLKDGEYFVNLANLEEQRLKHQAQNAEGMMRAQDLPEEVNGKMRAAIGKSNLLISQKFQQFHELCAQHMHPEPEERVPLVEDLQGFWDMIKIQIDNVDDMFAEIQHMSQNDWKEVPKQASRRSSASSSPKSAGSLSQASTPSATPGHTPGSKRRGLKGNSKDTPESSPERTQKARSAAKARDEARKKMLAEKRAAMKQQQQQQQQQQEGAADVEIFLADSRKQ